MLENLIIANKFQDSCFLCVKTFCWHYSRKTAAETLAKLMESFPNHDLQLDEIVKHYNDFYLRAYTKKGKFIHIYTKPVSNIIFGFSL